MEKVRRIYQHDDRLPRLVILSEPRKNSKTGFASFIVLLHTVGPEAKPFSQVVTAARVKDQAALTFDYCVNSILSSRTLAPMVDLKEAAKEYQVKGLRTRYKALSRDAKANLGRSPIVAIHDELGQVEGPTDKLYTNVETAMKAHKTPMSVVCSTQAPKDGDLLSLLIDDIINNPREDAVLFLSHAPKEMEEGIPEEGKTPSEWAHPPNPDYPFTDAALFTANPEAGILTNLDDLRREAADAKRMPSKEADYRNLTLNQRVDTVALFIPRVLWSNRARPGLELPPVSTPIWLGLDLSEVGDLTALAAIWLEKDGTMCWWARAWLPEFEIRERSRRDRVPYDVWAKQGHLSLVPGKAIDYTYAAKEVLKIWGAHNVQKAGFDRWGFRHFRKELKDLGKSDTWLDKHWSQVGMGTATMTPVLREMEQRILAGTFSHPNNPVLNMAASNMVVEGDAEARRPSKRSARARIDPMVAVAIAIASWLDSPTKRPAPLMEFI